jgi:hypothetical protein
MFVEKCIQTGLFNLVRVDHWQTHLGQSVHKPVLSKAIALVRTG